MCIHPKIALENLENSMLIKIMNNLRQKSSKECMTNCFVLEPYYHRELNPHVPRLLLYIKSNRSEIKDKYA